MKDCWRVKSNFVASIVKLKLERSFCKVRVPFSSVQHAGLGPLTYSNIHENDSTFYAPQNTCRMPGRDPQGLSGVALSKS